MSSKSAVAKKPSKGAKKPSKGAVGKKPRKSPVGKKPSKSAVEKKRRKVATMPCEEPPIRVKFNMAPPAPPAPPVSVFVNPDTQKSLGYKFPKPEIPHSVRKKFDTHPFTMSSARIPPEKIYGKRAHPYHRCGSPLKQSQTAIPPVDCDFPLPDLQFGMQLLDVQFGMQLPDFLMPDVQLEPLDMSLEQFDMQLQDGQLQDVPLQDVPSQDVQFGMQLPDVQLEPLDMSLEQFDMQLPDFPFGMSLPEEFTFNS